MKFQNIKTRPCPIYKTQVGNTIRREYEFWHENLRYCDHPQLKRAHERVLHMIKKNAASVAAHSLSASGVSIDGAEQTSRLAMVFLGLPYQKYAYKKSEREAIVTDIALMLEILNSKSNLWILLWWR